MSPSRARLAAGAGCAGFLLSPAGAQECDVCWTSACESLQTLLPPCDTKRIQKPVPVCSSGKVSTAWRQRLEISACSNNFGRARSQCEEPIRAAQTECKRCDEVDPPRYAECEAKEKRARDACGLPGAPDVTDASMNSRTPAIARLALAVTVCGKQASLVGALWRRCRRPTNAGTSAATPGRRHRPTTLS